jgi:hypothetical protein
VARGIHLFVLLIDVQEGLELAMGRNGANFFHGVGRLSTG